MSFNELQRQRTTRKKKRDARRKLVMRLMSDRKVDEGRTPLPELEPFLEEFVFWPHIETKEAVSEITSIGRDYLRDRTCFRVTEDGGWGVPGSDCILKPRRAFMTTLIWGCIVYFLIRFSRLRAVTAFQVGDQDEIIDPAISQWTFMLEKLPEYWVGNWRLKGNTIYLGRNRWIGPEKTASGGKWTPISSGHTPEIADKRGRSADCDIFHASETGIMPFPRPLFNAVGKALPPGTGMLISESTQPETREQYHARAYFDAKRGFGRFQRSFFWPWYKQPLKRIPRQTNDFRRFMSPEFEKELPPEEVLRETELELTDEQCAFRRREFFSGDPVERRLAHRENPESDTDGFVYAGEPYFDIGALEIAAARCRPPLNADDRHPLGRHFGISVWDWEPQGYLIFAADTAEKEGVDMSAVEVIDARTMDQVAEIHGRGLASEIAQGIKWLIDKLVDGRHYRYVLAIESNRGKALIGESEKLGLNQYMETAVKLSEKRRRKVKRYGISTQGYNRNKFIDAIGQAIEGPRADEEGLPRDLAPTCDIWSKYLVEEIKGLQYHDKKPNVRAGEGYHDDLPMAYGIARYIGGRVRIPARRYGGSNAPFVAEKRPRRSGGPLMPG